MRIIYLGRITAHRFSDTFLPVRSLTTYTTNSIPFFHRGKLPASQNILVTSTVDTLVLPNIRCEVRRANLVQSNEQRAHTYLRTRGLPSRLLGDFANEDLY